MRITKFLTDAEFNKAISRTRLSESNQEMARAVLAKRFKLQEVAEKHGQSKQALYKVVQRVWKKFLELESTPAGWVTIRVTLPEEEAEKVLALATELKAKNLINI